MSVHEVIDKRGISHLVHGGHMNYWLCDECGFPCGYTWTIEGVERHAFCRCCDSIVKQTSHGRRDDID